MSQVISPATIYRYLELHCMGAVRARTEKQLAEEFGLRGVIVREMIHDLRLEGKLIGSTSTGDNRGYYLPLTREEAVAGTAHLVHRLRSLAAVFESQMAAVDRHFGPPTLFDAPLPAVPVSCSYPAHPVTSEA